MTDDWWAAASQRRTATSAGESGHRMSAPPGGGSGGGRSGGDGNGSGAGAGNSLSMLDPLLSGLAASPHPQTPNLTVGGRYTAPGISSRARRAVASAHTPDVLSGLVLHEVVERATGHARPGRKGDDSAVRQLMSTVRTRGTRLESVLSAVAVSSDGSGGALYNARVLGLVHALLSAGPHALPSACSGASLGANTAGALRIVSDVHRAARRARGVGVSDVLGTGAMRDIRSLDAAPSVPRGEAAVHACEVYSVLLARKLTFSSAYGEVECNYSLDRWYRRLGIENRAESSRMGANNARQNRLLAAEVRTAALALVGLAAKAASLLLRARATKDAVAQVLAEGCHAYVFAEYVRAKAKAAGAPREAQRTLLDAIGVALDDVDAVALARFTGIDDPVAAEVLTTCGDDARAVRIDSRFRRNIVCKFSTFLGLHDALDPMARTRAKA